MSANTENRSIDPLDAIRHDPGRLALRHVLREARTDAKARRRALATLVDRVVWVATYEPYATHVRTVENVEGSLGLAVFTDLFELESAAAELGWRAMGEPLARKQVAMREIVDLVVRERFGHVVVDVASSHALEASRDELAPAEPVGPASTFASLRDVFGRATTALRQAGWPSPDLARR